MKKNKFKIYCYKGYVQNNYLLEYKNSILLIDGACRPDVEGIKKFVENDIKKKITDIKLIAVTHCHPDHAGAADILRRKYGIPIAAPHDIDHWYSGPGGILQHISDTLQTRFMARKLKSGINMLYFRRKLRPEYPLTDGDSLPFFEDWEAIHAPGHTSHNMMLLNRKAGILYISDTVIENNGKFLPPVPVLFPEMMKDTINKIKEIKPDIVLLAHSGEKTFKFDEEMFDQVIRKIERENSLFIKFFYLISKFTGEYRKYKKTC